MSDFDITRLNPLSDFLVGLRTINRIGDNDTPLDGDWSLASSGAAIMYHCPWVVSNVRSGCNGSNGWDWFAEKFFNLALTTRQAYQRPALKSTAFYGLKSHVSIGQLVMGESTFDPNQLPDSVLAGFGKVKKGMDKKADAKIWMQEQIRKHEEYMLFVQQRQPGGMAKSQYPWRTLPGTKLMIGGR